MTTGRVAWSRRMPTSTSSDPPGTVRLPNERGSGTTLYADATVARHALDLRAYRNRDRRLHSLTFNQWLRIRDLEPI